jgi:uncharacterized repeat protein (TIGR02543 family)
MKRLVFILFLAAVGCNGNSAGTKTVYVDVDVPTTTNPPTVVTTPTTTETYAVNYNTNGPDETNDPVVTVDTDQIITIFADTTAYNVGDIVYINDASNLRINGYTFAGWNTKSDGSGVELGKNENGKTFYQMSDANITFYAQWTSIPYTVTYDGNGGINPPDAQTYIFYQTLVFPSQGSMSNGSKTFIGWGYSSTATTAITAEPVCSNLTLYAIWE